MRRRCALGLLGIGLLGFGSRPASARAAGTNLCSLVAGADTIVVAKVVEVFDDHGVVMARAAPTRTLKGKPQPELFFLAEGTWLCDTSTALPGEKVLLFLEKPKSQVVSRRYRDKPTVEVSSRPFFLIQHSGRGRMPLRTWDGVLKVIVSEVSFPDTIEIKYEGTVGDLHQTVVFEQMVREISRRVARDARERRR